ncbi:MAG: radical SAM protein [bacterium]
MYFSSIERYRTAWRFSDILSQRRLIGGGLDITNKCNLRCSHCYWWRQKKNPDLSDDEMIAFMRKLKKQGFKIIYLLGGEPLLRPEVCAAAGRIFDFPMIFTNGTLGFPQVGHARYALSIDGPPEIHNRIRGAGIFEEVVKKLGESLSPVMIHVTVCRSNREYLREIIELFIRRPQVSGLYFCFFCPSSGSGGNKEFIPLEERDRVIDEITAYRNEYGSKILMTERIGHYLKTDGGFSCWNSHSRCITRDLFKFYSADGSYKYSCAYGKEADCGGCGCSQVPIMHAMLDKDRETMKMAYRDYWGLSVWHDKLLDIAVRWL